MPVRPLLAITVVTLLWAGNFSAGKVATHELHWALIASIRILLAALVFWLFVPRGTIAAMRWKSVLPLALSGIVLNQIFFMWGISLTTPAHSSVIHALIPACVFLMAAAFLGERPVPGAVVGMILAVGGAVFLALRVPPDERAATLPGDLLTFIGMVAFAGYIVLGRYATATEGALVTVSRAFVAGAPFAVPLLLYGALQQNWAAVTWRGWSALGYMVVAATFICYALHMWALSRLEALKVAVFTDAQPILATLIAQAIGIERVTPALVAAGAVVIAGVGLVQFSRGRRW